MKKPTLPKEVIILGRKWTIKVEEQYDEEPDTFGATDDNEMVITLYTNPHEDYPQRGTIKSTFFHECLHAALKSSGTGALLNEPNNDGREEALVTALEHALWPLIEQGLFR